jgi:hypothetical protein
MFFDGLCPALFAPWPRGKDELVDLAELSTDVK